MQLAENASLTNPQSTNFNPAEAAKKFLTDNPELLPITAVALATLVSDQLVPANNFKMSDISAALLFKSVQGICERWQGVDEDKDEKGLKPDWIKQATLVSLVGAWTLYANYNKWDAIAIAGASFTASLIKNWMRKLEDCKLGKELSDDQKNLSEDEIEKIEKKLEKERDPVRFYIKAAILTSLTISGFAIDTITQSGMQIGQIAAGISLDGLEREYRKKILDPTKIDLENCSTEELERREELIEAGIEKVPRSKVILVANTVLTASAAVTARLVNANITLTSTMIGLLSMNVKQWIKSDRLQKENEKQLQDYRDDNKEETTSKLESLKEIVIDTTPPFQDEHIAMEDKEAKAQKKEKKKDKDKASKNDKNTVAEDNEAKALKKAKKKEKKKAKKSKKNGENFTPPSVQKQSLIIGTTLGAAFATTFAGVPIITSALTKIGSRMTHYATDSTAFDKLIDGAKPSNQEKRSWAKVATRVMIAAPLAMIGGAIKLWGEGASSAVKHVADVIIPVASTQLELNAKDWALGKGLWEKKEEPESELLSV